MSPFEFVKAFIFCSIIVSCLALDDMEYESHILNSLNTESNTTLDDQELAQRLPGAIIIGAKKCGTRALLKFIGAHPNVSTAGAEVHFFDRFYHMGLDWYR